MNTFGALISNQTLQDVSLRLQDYIETLKEPKNFAIATSSVAATIVLYKIIQNYRDAQKAYPNFEGAGLFGDQRPLLRSASSALEFWRKVNPRNYAAGYCKFSIEKHLIICDLHLLKELFLTHGMASIGRFGGVRAHLGDEYKHGVLFRDAPKK